MDDAAPPPAVESSRAQPRRARTLAQTIAGRASDLLAIGLVLLVGLTSGQQIVAWWRTEPGMPPVMESGHEWADWDARAVEMTFGENGASLSRRLIEGDRSAAEQELIRLCGEVAERVQPTDEPAVQAESVWLSQLAALPPAREAGDGTPAIYLPPSPLPQAVAVGQASSRSAAATEHRITATGWAFPHGEKRWLVYAAPFAGRTVTLSGPEVPLPPGAQPILGWSDADGVRVIAFEGNRSLSDWMAYYRQRSEWQIRQMADGTVSLHRSADGIPWDIQLRADRDRVSGVCWCAGSGNPQATAESSGDEAGGSRPKP